MKKESKIFFWTNNIYSFIRPFFALKKGLIKNDSTSDPFECSGQ